MEPFRTRATQEPETAPKEAPQVELTDSGNQDKAITPSPEFSQDSELEKFEIRNGKYGLDYFGIKEIGKVFPLNAQFGLVDKYIKEELGIKGYDKTPESYQKILNEIEKEIDSSKLNAYERLKKLSGYIRAIKKFNEAKKKKELYSAFRTEFNDSQD